MGQWQEAAPRPEWPATGVRPRRSRAAASAALPGWLACRAASVAAAVVPSHIGRSGSVATLFDEAASLRGPAVPSISPFVIFSISYYASAGVPSLLAAPHATSPLLAPTLALPPPHPHASPWPSSAAPSWAPLLSAPGPLRCAPRAACAWLTRFHRRRSSTIRCFRGTRRLRGPRMWRQ